MKTTEIYQAVTDRIITLLEQGVAPWRKSWSAGGFHAPRNGIPGRNENKMIHFIRMDH